MVRFLPLLLREVPGKLLVIWDGATIHRCQAVKDFLAKGGAKRMQLERLPASAPELNPQEGVWNLLKRVELKNVCGLDTPQIQRELRRAKERLRHRTSVLRQCFAHAGYSLSCSLLRSISELLGKEQWKEGVYGGKDVIVVATQVVEVGLDISVETLHTQLAPANSLLQRAGRCARFALQRGRVVVYPLPEREDGKLASTLPYDADLCAQTWETLEKFEGEPMGFREEQALINIVHTPGDLDLLRRYEDRHLDLQDDITRCLQTHEREHASELIRDVTQVQVLIHDDPGKAITTEPWRWQSFGLHPSQLLGKHWARLQEKRSELDLDWLAKYPELSPEAQEDEQQEADSRVLATYTWQSVTSESMIPGALMIAMPQQLVTYDNDLGLVFRDGRLALSKEWQQRLDKQPYQSQLCARRKSANSGQATSMQRYAQHIGGLANAYHYALVHELDYVMTRLEELLDLAPGTLDHAIQLAIVTHDLGKLGHEWQRWAHAWQQLYMEKKNWTAQYREPANDYFFAKTD